VKIPKELSTRRLAGTKQTGKGRLLKNKKKWLSEKGREEGMGKG